MKLELKKEKILELKNHEMNLIHGGDDEAKTNVSSNHDFTCCWCVNYTFSTKFCGTQPPGTK